MANRNDTPIPSQSQSDAADNGKQTCIESRRLFTDKIKKLNNWLENGHKMNIRYIKYYHSVLENLYEDCIWLGPHDDDLRVYGKLDDEIVLAGCSRWPSLMKRVKDHDAFNAHLAQIEQEAMGLQDDNGSVNHNNHNNNNTSSTQVSGNSIAANSNPVSVNIDNNNSDSNQQPPIIV